ncbi:MAG TPA: ankyrin repeat domain-containing protein, partial [Verrucomicrobiae bacterium]|nr:ankyrin repeat domain-containing protein [Verrucomicrobiae bacterium]
NDLELAEWCLAHGANPNAGPPRAQTLPQQSLHAQALQSGLPEMAALLERFGAKTSGSTVQQDAFRAACFRLDRAGAQRLAQAKPEYLLDPAPMRKAAEQDRADVIELLLDLGMSPDIEDPKEGNQRPLHAAAYSNAARAAKVLIQAGAEIDNRESNHHATPLGFAIWSEAWDAIEMIAPRSREVWNLVFLGKVERLREVLVEKPELAKSVSSEGETLLMQLPDDDGKALEIARLLLSHGANPSARNMAGLSAADLARKRGLEEVAALLESPAPSVSVIDAPIAADENRRE